MSSTENVPLAPLEVDKPLATFAKEDGFNDSIKRGLAETLAEKQELFLDFTSLKACLDPQREKSDGEEFDYEDFLFQQLERVEIFSNLEMLKIRNLKINLPLNPESETYYADLLYRTMQLSSLVELDLSGVTLPVELQQHLTFWSMKSLKKLCLDEMGLTTLPPSVGQLRQLEVLSLKGNNLRDLPVTLIFCQKLKDLNLKKNQFHSIPGILLRLSSLQELRRHDNPLPQLYHGFEAPPHIKISSQSSSTKQTNPVFNPGSLQSSCTRVVFTHHIDYWANSSIGSLQCKILDCLASQFTLCDHCNAAITRETELTVDVMLLQYLDLRYVPFKFSACSSECQAATLQHYRDVQTQMQADIDREYEDSVKQAERQAKRSETSDHYLCKTHYNHGRNRRYNCAIM